MFVPTADEPTRRLGFMALRTKRLKLGGGRIGPHDIEAGTALFSYGGGRAPNAASSWQVVVGSMASVCFSLKSRNSCSTMCPWHPGMLALAVSCMFDGLACH